jgi:hypothetical protein
MTHLKVESSDRSLTLKIDIFDLIHENLDPDQHVEFVESLSCSDKVIDHVMEQIFDGYTYNGFRGNLSSNPTSTYTALDRARNRIIQLADKEAQDKIKELSDAYDKLQIRYNDLTEKMYKTVY